MPDLPGRELAQELIGKSRAESRATPIEAVIAAAGEDGIDSCRRRSADRPAVDP